MNDFWEMRDEVHQAFTDFKRTGSEVCPYLMKRKDPDGQISDKAVGSIFRAICHMRNVVFRHVEKHRNKALVAGVERLWSPHNLIDVDLLVLRIISGGASDC